ncbi:hypothetical protein Tco_1123876 [Tanacetum coccineum]|uniref:Uncharacterized protein n=1 Tax=Tanacetum coccineum TaxID=301880 RepID=A0ABQ5J5N8_9ASTR
MRTVNDCVNCTLYARWVYVFHAWVTANLDAKQSYSHFSSEGYYRHSSTNHVTCALEFTGYLSILALIFDFRLEVVSLILTCLLLQIALTFKHFVTSRRT